MVVGTVPVPGPTAEICCTAEQNPAHVYTDPGAVSPATSGMFAAKRMASTAASPVQTAWFCGALLDWQTKLDEDELPQLRTGASVAQHPLATESIPPLPQ